MWALVLWWHLVPRTRRVLGCVNSNPGQTTCFLLLWQVHLIHLQHHAVLFFKYSLISRLCHYIENLIERRSHVLFHQWMANCKLKQGRVHSFFSTSTLFIIWIWLPLSTFSILKGKISGFISEEDKLGVSEHLTILFFSPQHTTHKVGGAETSERTALKE